jgi:hypothetical protein
MTLMCQCSVIFTVIDTARRQSRTYSMTDIIEVINSYISVCYEAVVLCIVLHWQLLHICRLVIL